MGDIHMGMHFPMTPTTTKTRTITTSKPRMATPSADCDTHILGNRQQLVPIGRDCPPVRTNAHPLSSFTDPASLRLEHKYDWNTGEVKEVRGDILSNSRRHMSRLAFHAETAEPTHPHDHDNCYVGPCKGMACPAPALPAVKASNPKKKNKNKR
jgi:hypothetical protein